MAQARTLRRPPPPAPAPGQIIPDLDEVSALIEKRLFVGRLPRDVTEEELREIFEEFGPVTEVRVLPGKGVAFVGFESWAATHRALIATDGQRQVSGHPEGHTMHTKFAERSGAERTGSRFAKGLEYTRLFVGGLPEDTQEEDLRELVEPFGQVEDSHLLPAKGRRRCGFATFSLWGEALDCCEALNGQPHPSGSEEHLKVVFAQNMHRSGEHADQADLEPPRSKRPRLDDGGEAPRTGAVRRHSEFERARSDYLAALEDGSPREVCDRLHRLLMDLRPAPRQPVHEPRRPSPRREGPPPRPLRERPRSPERRPARAASADEDRDAGRIYVGNLPPDCTDEELGHLVRQLPFRAAPENCELLECRVVPGRGCGYVRFAGWDAANEAIDELNDRQVKGWEQPLRARWVSGSAPPAPRGGHALPSRPVINAGALPWRNGGGGREQDGETDYRRLFVGQLQALESSEPLRGLFEPYGRVEECRYLDHKGVAFVSFERERDARRAMQELNGASVPGISRNEGLKVIYATRR